MPRKSRSRSVSKPKIIVEKSTAGTVKVGRQKSGGPAMTAARPAPSPAQLDARQAAIKRKRKASGPARTAKSLNKVVPADVPAVEPQQA